MAEHWRENPPVQAMIAAYLGIEPPQEKQSNIAELLALIPEKPRT